MALAYRNPRAPRALDSHTMIEVVKNYPTAAGKCRRGQAKAGAQNDDSHWRRARREDRYDWIGALYGGATMACAPEL